MRKWFAVLALVCVLPTAAEERTVASLERPVAQLVEMERGETTKQTFVFTQPGKGKAWKIPSGAGVLLTGEKFGGWSEVWVEDIGMGWVSTSAIRNIDSRK